MGYALVPLPPYRPDRLNVWVREATSGSDRRRAAALHRRINRGDRYWIAPPRRERQRALSVRTNTGLQEVALGVFIAEAQSAVQTDQVVGSMAVWVAEKPEAELLARFGLFEVINEAGVAERLIEAAEMWLLEQFPVSAIRGPYSLDGRQPPGLLTGGFDVRSAAGLPYNPPYYLELIEDADYAPCQTTRTYLLPARVSADPPQVRVVSSNAGAQAGFRVSWEESGETLDAFIVAPDRRTTLSHLMGRLPRPLARLRPNRLYAHPADLAAEPACGDRWLALCRAVAGAAVHMGCEEVLLGPIADDAENLIAELRTLGARPAHTYQVFEKEF